MTKPFNKAFEALEKLLKEAARTLKRCRFARHDLPDKMRSAWPEVVRNAADAYGYTPLKVTPTVPSPGEIDRMNRAVMWLLHVPEDDRRIVWGRAERYTWRDMEHIERVSVVTLTKRHQEALEAILVGMIERERAT